MRKLFFLLLIILPLLFMPLVLGECTNTVDDFSSEVLLNKPGIEFKLSQLTNANNIIIQDNKYILQSVYNPNLAVVLEQIDSNLLVRLQIPVDAKEKVLPYLKFTSNSRFPLNISTQEYSGWKVTCLEGSPVPQCEFKKAKTTILASLISQGKYDIVIETSEELKNCALGCDGACIISQEPKCINPSLKNDIESILKFSGLIENFNDLSNYRVITSSNIQRIDISPTVPIDIIWPDAMKQELLNLRQENIISITLQDIEDISQLAKEGAAGTNNRIIYGENKNGDKVWAYNYNTRFPTMTQIKDCSEFPLSLVPTGMITFTRQQILPTYYLIPVIITVILVILFFGLIGLSRMLEMKRKKSQLKPVTGLQQAG